VRSLHIVKCSKLICYRIRGVSNNFCYYAINDKTKVTFNFQFTADCYMLLCNILNSWMPHCNSRWDKETAKYGCLLEISQHAKLQILKRCIQIVLATWKLRSMAWTDGLIRNCKPKLWRMKLAICLLCMSIWFTVAAAVCTIMHSYINHHANYWCLWYHLNYR
jgi:hypothetical protein